LSAPTAGVVASADGVVVHGAVCRTGAQASRAPYGVRVERISADGKVTDAATAALSGASLSGRTPGCAYYTARTGWSLAEGERLSVEPLFSDPSTSPLGR
jgi:hypothetical protein